MLIYLLAFDPVSAPISATSFNRNGTLLAYAISYDWSKGHKGATDGSGASSGGVKIMLHRCQDSEVQKKIRR